MQEFHLQKHCGSTEPVDEALASDNKEQVRWRWESVEEMEVKGWDIARNGEGVSGGM